MKNMISACVLSMLLVNFCNIMAHGWASRYSIDIVHKNRNNLQKRQAVIVEQPLQEPASQLIFSWNAHRPAHGHYAFYVQVRLQGSKRWSDWYKIAEWGNGVQRSFEQLMQDDPSFCYVRLEAPNGFLVQECRLKIEAHDQASLIDVARVTISAVDYHQFVSEYGKGRRFSFPSVRLNHVPAFSQMESRHPERDRICSPTSLAMVVSYLLKRYIDPTQFANGVYDDGLKSYGSWPFNVAYAFDLTGGRFYFAVTRLNSFAQLYSFLHKRLPVVVSVRGPLHTMPQGKTYADGHLLVVIGWDDVHKRVIVLDPAFETRQAVLHSYAIDDFLAAWERSYRLAYVVEPAG